jgi:hypothetical protein
VFVNTDEVLDFARPITHKGGNLFIKNKHSVKFGYFNKFMSQFLTRNHFSYLHWRTCWIFESSGQQIAPGIGQRLSESKTRRDLYEFWNCGS